MGTTVGARIWWQDPTEAEQLLALVQQDMERINATYSPYIEASELSFVNRQAASQPVTLSPEFAAMIDRALWAYKISDGAFDISYAAVGELYDYRAQVAPDAQTIANKLPAVGKLNWQPENRQLGYNHPHVKIDLGGLAKGFAVEQAAQILRQRGVKHGSVNAGGDTRLLGDNLGKPWMIGIKNPRPKQATDHWQSVLKLPLVDEAISTSGDYERFFIDDKTKQRIHHIINPKTGHSSHGVISATVIGPDGRSTDPLSTAVFVMGVQAGLAMIDQIPGYEAVVISSQGDVHYSAGLTPR